MNYTQIVREYIEKIDVNTPIFLSDIKNLVGEKGKMILTRLVRDGVIDRFGYGVYYKPTQTIWGNSVIGNDTIIRRKYIEDANGNRKGYITGARLFNHLGLTTQVPRMTEIVSNECRGKNKIVTEYSAVVIRPKIIVNNENYLYQQLLDVIENKANIQVESDAPKAVIQDFYNSNQLDFAELYRTGLERGATKRNLDKMVDLILR